MKTALVPLLPLLAPVQAAEAPDFTLPQRGTNELVRLADFAGQILVLDFFAYWCGPCQKASAEIEQHIAQHYSRTGGNAARIPVRVVAVNVEPDQAARTDAFIRKHGLRFVVDDRAGRTLEAYGGRGLPFIVIVDGTRATRDQPTFEIVYR